MDERSETNPATEGTEDAEDGTETDPALDPSPSLLSSSVLSVASVARSPAVVLALLAGFGLCLVMEWRFGPVD